MSMKPLALCGGGLTVIGIRNVAFLKIAIIARVGAARTPVARIDVAPAKRIPAR
jgi:hypothetical protein